MVESLPHEVEETIVPGGGWMQQTDLNDSEDLDIQNDYSVTEKLDIALEMAEGIAELHGFKDGVIVHDDVQLCQCGNVPWNVTNHDTKKYCLTMLQCLLHQGSEMMRGNSNWETLIGRECWRGMTRNKSTANTTMENRTGM